MKKLNVEKIDYKTISPRLKSSTIVKLKKLAKKNKISINKTLEILINDAVKG